MNPSSPPLPANYRTIYEVVNEFGEGRHASAHDVYVRARERRPGIGFTTVHRGLARLHEMGLILKLDIPGEGAAMYEPAAKAHAHFRCTGCGTVLDVDYATSPETLTALQARHGLAILTESVTFSGLCPNCSS